MHCHPWSAFAMTKRAHRILGLFDKSFHPTYWEDDDMKIRPDRAVKADLCSAIKYLTSTSLKHNNNDDYVR